MKLYLIILCFLLLPNFSFADPMKIGIKGGINLSNIPLENGLYLGGEEVAGFDGGLFADLPIIDFLSFQPEAIFILKGSQLYDSSGVFGSLNYPLPYLEFPFNLKFKILSLEKVKVNLLIGEYVSFLLPGLYPTSKAISNAGYVSGTFNNLDVGGLYGISFELNDFVLETRYESGGRAVFNTTSNGGTISGGFNSSVLFSLGYKFLSL